MDRCKIAFRADASGQIGTGHFVRCLTLADFLGQRGAQIRFVSRHLLDHLRDMLAARGYEFIMLDDVQENEVLDESGHAAWLGVSQARDATDSILALSDQTWDWLVVDHYALDFRWETMLRKTARKLLVIDDLADRRHDCDVLLDQNLVPDMRSRYGDKLPDNCLQLLGPSYALLQPEYADLHTTIAARSNRVNRLFVYFGGGDNSNLTGKTVSAFLALKRSDIRVDVVVSANSFFADSIRKLVACHDNICVHSNLPSLALLMSKADLAIGGGGATSWERICLGLRTLVITVAENQNTIAKELDHRGLIRLLGDHSSADEGTIAAELNSAFNLDPDRLFSAGNESIVDGKGCDRVCAALMVTDSSELYLRSVAPGDKAVLLEWANDPVTRRNSMRQSPISEAEHHRWFEKCTQNKESCKFYIVETRQGVSIGQVRFELVDQQWELHYSLSPVFRGLRLGKRLLEMALREISAVGQVNSVVAKARRENIPSQKVLESVGFETTKVDDEVIEYSLSFD